MWGFVNDEMVKLMCCDEGGESGMRRSEAVDLALFVHLCFAVCWLALLVDSGRAACFV